MSFSNSAGRHLQDAQILLGEQRWDNAVYLAGYVVEECFQEQSIVNTLIPKLQSVTIIRDVNGKIRIYLEPSETSTIEESETTNLNNFLSTKLGKYYGNDIWLPTGEKDAYKALIKTIKDERIFASWDDKSVLPRWYILERHIAKQAWTGNQVGTPPWPEAVVYQNHKKPAIISFFSFKGGVGRTSSLVATALTLARNGHRVAIVDLDLEGFHDIGGLAITALSHAAVIFGTQSRQSWAGLTHVIRHLASPGVDERLPLILVHSMAPAIGISGRETELQEFREQAYSVFQENYYSEDETVPDTNNRDEPFFPVVVPYQEVLRGDIALFSRNSTPEESTRLSDFVKNIMTSYPYQDIAEKLCRLFGREFRPVDN